MAGQIPELNTRLKIDRYFDVRAAANFFEPLKERAESLGLGTLAVRFAQMTEADLRTAAVAEEHYFVPSFMYPEAYANGSDETLPTAVIFAERLRQLVLARDLKSTIMGSMSAEIGSLEDGRNQETDRLLGELIKHSVYQPSGTIEPAKTPDDPGTRHLFIPTLYDGIAVDRAESIYAQRNNGSSGKQLRTIDYTAFRIGESLRAELK